MTDATPEPAAFKRAGDELPELGRDVVLRFAPEYGGGMREACRMPLELMRERGILPPEIDASREVWGSENGDMSYVRDDDEWIYAEDYQETPEDVLKYTAVTLLKVAATLRELSTGVLERTPGLDRAARMALLRSSDGVAFVASLTDDQYLSEEVEAEFRKLFPAFDIDHGELLGMAGPREQMQHLLAAGVVSPFVNMADPPKWPAEERAEALEAALSELVATQDSKESIQTLGDVELYERRRDAAWERARALLEPTAKIVHVHVNTGATPDIRACRECGCTEDDACEDLNNPTGACSWAEEDLCSACHAKPGDEGGAA